MKRLMNILMIVLVCITLGGCHGSKGTSGFTVPEQFDTDRQYTITFWAKNDTNINQVNIYKKAIADFESIYPNITVNMKLYTDYSRIYNDVITNISTGTTPNVCITYPDHIATYMTGSNVVVNLDDLIADEKYGLGGNELRFDGPERDEMIEEFFSECMFSGSYYALPYMRSTEALYMNKTYIEKLGFEIPDIVTWDFVWQVCAKAMEKDGNDDYLINGQKVLIPFIYKSTDNMMISMLKQLDAGYSDDSGQIMIFNDTTKDLLKQVGDHASKGEFSTFKISSYPANFLNAGQCLFAVDSTAGATWMGSDAPLVDIPEDKLVQFETIVRPIPQFDTQNIWMISQGPSLCVFNKEDDQEVLASWLFAQYLLSNDVQIAYSKTEGYVPVTAKAQNSKEYQEYLSLRGSDDVEHYSIKIDAANLLLENTSHTFVTSVFNGSASLRDAAGNLIESVCKAVRKKQTIDDSYLDDLFSQTRSLYHLDQTSAVSSYTDLGPLPVTSRLLLAGLALTWLSIGVYWLYTRRK
ncbi:MAG: carbohydrate ABC transporter substrate-binding protein [Erysipelotrichaceae bacterium]|nr:carbohydrate ABC transporter substrate-binding protein [Erysipelotrichaceae bacterium]